MIKGVLFVCTGNACRSPMAQVIFKKLVNNDPSLLSACIEVDSAGTGIGLDSATPEAIECMAEYGLNLNSHQPKSITSDLVQWADLVLVMESRHRDMVLSRFPNAAKKTHLLSEYVGESGDVPDPYLQGIEIYQKCAATLQSLLKNLAEKLKS
ncbi:MAG TPA: low molecular weight protein arginine phosphatase [Dehalococcoidia bacterium]|nr:low molecular weight protein arginine phosphatase [Dehalococcoidia bacterium]